MSVYLTLQKNYGGRGKSYDRFVAVQKCGEPPYEISLRFAQCCLQCGACFASGYSWPDKFLLNRRVKENVSLERLVSEFRNLPRPDQGAYNWMRILGGEPLLNDEYVSYLFDFIHEIAQIDDPGFNDGIIIQTNGIHIGQDHTRVIRDRLQQLNSINPDLTIVVETSIKGTNPEEFQLISQSDKGLFEFNIDSYYRLRDLDLPNLRASVIAGYGISESILLSDGNKAKSHMTILYDKDTPTYHPSLWSGTFTHLYKDFTSDWSSHDSMFGRMPMYGIKDQFNYGWVTRALRQGKQVMETSFTTQSMVPGTI